MQSYNIHRIIVDNNNNNHNSVIIYQYMGEKCKFVRVFYMHMYG